MALWVLLCWLLLYLTIDGCGGYLRVKFMMFLQIKFDDFRFLVFRLWTMVMAKWHCGFYLLTFLVLTIDGCDGYLWVKLNSMLLLLLFFLFCLFCFDVVARKCTCLGLFMMIKKNWSFWACCFIMNIDYDDYCYCKFYLLKLGIWQRQLMV